MYAHQDWNTVYLKKTTEKHVESKQKTSAGNQEYIHKARKLEADINTSPTEEAPPSAPLATLSHSMRQCMIKARTDKKMTQQDLANRCNVQVAVIKALEGGSVVQDKSILNKINRHLGAHLRFDQ